MATQTIVSSPRYYLGIQLKGLLIGVLLSFPLMYVLLGSLPPFNPVFPAVLAVLVLADVLRYAYLRRHPRVLFTLTDEELIGENERIAWRDIADLVPRRWPQGRISVRMNDGSIRRLQYDQLITDERELVNAIRAHLSAGRYR